MKYRIRAIMENINLSYANLAEIIGISVRTLRIYETQGMPQAKMVKVYNLLALLPPQTLKDAEQKDMERNKARQIKKLEPLIKKDKPVVTAHLVIQARKKLNLSVDKFGKIFNVSGRTVEGWEQGRALSTGKAIQFKTIF